tara:strand:+ start:3064 stop:4044 length:981 start_codon:yes stop_codon:yes gene_type:complete
MEFDVAITKIERRENAIKSIHLESVADFVLNRYGLYHDGRCIIQQKDRSYLKEILENWQTLQKQFAYTTFVHLVGVYLHSPDGRRIYVGPRENKKMPPLINGDPIEDINYPATSTTYVLDYPYIQHYANVDLHLQRSAYCNPKLSIQNIGMTEEHLIQLITLDIDAEVVNWSKQEDPDLQELLDNHHKQPHLWSTLENGSFKPYSVYFESDFENSIEVSPKELKIHNLNHHESYLTEIDIMQDNKFIQKILERDRQLPRGDIIFYNEKSYGVTSCGNLIRINTDKDNRKFPKHEFLAYKTDLQFSLELYNQMQKRESLYQDLVQLF